MDSTKYKLTIKFKKPILGTRPQKDVAKEFIISKFSQRVGANNENIPTDSEGLPEDEVGTLSEALEKGTTAFPKHGGRPVAFDFQVKGFLKAAGEIFNGERDVKAMKSKLNNLVFVTPRLIPFNLPEAMLVPDTWDAGNPIDNDAFDTYDAEIDAWLFEGGPVPMGFKEVPSAITMNDRSLRAQTMQGPRTTLAISEQLPSGTWIECQLEVLGSKISEPLLRDLLGYGQHQGMLQWRSAGYGSFYYDLEKLP